MACVRWIGLACCVAVACGPSVGTSSGGGDGGAETGAETGAEGSDGPGGSGAGEGYADAEGDADSSGATSSGGDSAGGTTSGGELPACGLARRLDRCCNQPIPAIPEEIDADTCLVPWPEDLRTLPAGVLEACTKQQPEVCGIVDCDNPPPPTEVVAFDDEGVCRYVCGEGLSLGYQDPGCEPPPIVECLPPPPPCAMDYCSCQGEIIVGCGVLLEPWQAEGACE